MSDLPPAKPDPAAPTPDAGGERKRKKDKSLFHFWRALKYLGPHRRLVVTSILCAFFVGLTFTGGLSTMLPILKVLMGGEPVQVWTGRMMVEKRLGVTLNDSRETLGVYSVGKNASAEAAGLKAGDELRVGTTDGVKATVAALADPSARLAEVQITRAGGTITKAIPLPELPWYYALLQRGTNLLPEHPVWAIACILGVMFTLGIVGNIVRFYQEYFSDKAAILAVNDIRRKLYDHVLHIPVG